MSKLDYKKIQTIEENTTRKLIKYINDFVKKDKILDSIEFYYPDFDEQKTKTAFNIWISTDYRTNYGKSFIEHMLEEKASYLTSLEREILIERNKSFISLFEIDTVQDDNIRVQDLLTKKQHIIWDPTISHMLKPKDLIFGRIGRIINHKGFIGNLSFLPPSVREEFVGEVFVDFNRARFKLPKLSINEYLKIYSINIYRIYTECIYEAMDSDENLTNALYDELDEFEDHLQNYMSRIQIKKHITNLINLYEYYLMKNDLTLYDMDELDFDYLFKKAVKEGHILSQKELSSYISTFKKYLGFLKTKDAHYRKSYEDLLGISKNRFLYLDNTKFRKLPFSINKVIVDNLSHKLSEDAFDFIMDYERFLLFIMSSPLKTTAKRKHLKRKYLIELNDIMEYGEVVKKKAPNQKDFPMLDLFYRFSLDNRLLKLRGDYLSVTRASPSFLRLNDEEKYSMFLQYIWSHNLIASNKKTMENRIYNQRDMLLGLLSSFEDGKWYNIEDIYASASFLPSESLKIIYKYLNMMGILEYKDYPTLAVSITHFGKMISNIFNNKNKGPKHSGRIIYLNR